MTATTLPQIPAAATSDRLAGGKVQLAHVDLVVGQACELRCVGCTNGMGMLDHLPMFKTQAVLDDIENAARVMRADKVCLLGGEALLHKDIVPIMAAARALSDVVQVLTNGIALERMPEEFWAEVDWLKISVYPGRTPQSAIDLALAKQADWGFELDYKPVAADPFRAVLTHAERSEDDARETFARCWFRTYTRKIEAGHFWRCCTSPSISTHLLRLNPDVDGLRLPDATVEKLSEFLAFEGPMRSCFRCHGNLGPVLPVWSEERDKAKWLERSLA